MATYERIPRGNLGLEHERKLVMEKEQECEHRLQVKRQVIHVPQFGIVDTIECVRCGAEWKDMGVGQ